MKRSWWPVCLLVCVTGPLRADSAQEVHDLFQKAAGALSDRKAPAFEAAFDFSQPGLGKLRASVEALLKASDIQSNIEWDKNEGDDQSRRVQLNWLLEITDRGGVGALTHRRARVECLLKKKGDAWRIVSFTPADFFAPSQADEAWGVVMTAALALTESAASNPASNADADMPAANTHKFLEAFDPAMPGYPQLKQSVLGLEQSADIESTVDLQQNEGDDRVRTLTVDWSMNLVSRETTVTMVQRRQTVTCKLEKQGKRWRITALDPQTFFASAGAGKTPNY